MDRMSMSDAVRLLLRPRKFTGSILHGPDGGKRTDSDHQQSPLDFAGASLCL